MSVALMPHPTLLFRSGGAPAMPDLRKKGRLPSTERLRRSFGVDGVRLVHNLLAEPPALPSRPAAPTASPSPAL